MPGAPDTEAQRRGGPRMRDKLFATVTVLTVIFVAGCASGLRVTGAEKAAGLHSAEKRLVLLSGSEWDPEIREAFSRHGFTVTRFVAPRVIERDVSPTTRERFHQADARYGITVYAGRPVDWCIINDGVKLGRVTFELTDIRTNEVVFTISKGGWTKGCPFSTSVFDELVDEFVGVWNGARTEK